MAEQPQQAAKQVEMQNVLVGDPVAINPDAKDPELGQGEKTYANSRGQEDYEEQCFCFTWTSSPPKSFCGGEATPRPDLDVWVPEDKYFLWIPFAAIVVGLLGSLVHFLDPVTWAVLAPPNLVELFAGAIVGCFSFMIFLPLGIPVWYCGCPVVYTRKILHVFLTIISPLALVSLSGNETLARAMYLSIVWNSASLTLSSGLSQSIPGRRYCCPIRVAYAAIDRPEDRPFTNFWITLQQTAVTVLNTPMIEWLVNHEKPLLIWIPFLALGLGDGLAEPVGKLYGKHKYETTAVFSDKKYTRSYEGSATVFIFTTVAVMIALPQMNWAQAAACFLLVPIASTVAEAKSPHTMDNHFMLGTIWIILYIIFDVLPLE